MNNLTEQERKELGKGEQTQYITDNIFSIIIKVFAKAFYLILIPLIIFIFFKTGIMLFILILNAFVGLIIILCNYRTLKEQSGRYEGKCPNCKQNIWISAVQYSNGDKIDCPLCGGKVGYYKGRFYEITQTNKQYFQTEAEKTNDLLKEQAKQSNSSSNLSRIKELKELLDTGAITEEEYQQEKSKLLNQ